MLHNSRQNAIKEARQLFETAGKTRYDYPEFVFDAWIAFEHREGTASDLRQALMVSAREMTFVNRRRQQVSSFPIPRRQQIADKADSSPVTGCKKVTRSSASLDRAATGDRGRYDEQCCKRRVG